MVTYFQGGCTSLRALSWYRELQQRKYRYQHGFFLLEGTRAIEQLVHAHPEAIDELLVTDAFIPPESFSCYVKRLLTSVQFKTIVTAATPQGVAAVVRLPPKCSSGVLPDVPGERILLLEDVQDPGNVGTLIRTAVAFNYSGVILSRLSADPFAPKAVQASVGALLNLWIRRVDTYINMVMELKTRGYALLGTDCAGCAPIDFSQYNRFVIALGNEGSGLSENVLSLTDVRFAIPIDTTGVQSLNVAVSGAITLFAGQQKLRW